MSQGLTNYTISKLINHLLGRSAFTMPGTVYAALFTSQPDVNGGGTEVSGFGYARQPITASMNNSTGGSQSTNNAIVRYGPASGGAWGTIGFAAIFDAPSGGNMLCFAPLEEAVVVDDGNAFEFDVAALSFGMS